MSTFGCILLGVVIGLLALIFVNAVRPLAAVESLLDRVTVLLSKVFKR